MSDIQYCASCGAECSPGQLVEFEDQPLCPECLEHDTVLCSRCGERIWREDNAGTDETPLCQCCYDRWYTSCEHCGRLIHLDDTYYDDDDEDQECPTAIPAIPDTQKTGMLSVLARECEARGTDATGVSYNSGGKLRIYKRPVPAHFLRFRIPEDAAVIMGHTRMTTQGNEKFNRNNHPFPGHIRDLDFALAHNGVLYNDTMLRRSMSLPGTKIQTDSYIAVQLIQQKKALDLSSLAYMAEQVEGFFRLQCWMNRTISTS